MLPAETNTLWLKSLMSNMWSVLYTVVRRGREEMEISLIRQRERILRAPPPPPLQPQHVWKILL